MNPLVALASLVGGALVVMAEVLVQILPTASIDLGTADVTASGLVFGAGMWSLLIALVLFIRRAAEDHWIVWAAMPLMLVLASFAIGASFAALLGFGTLVFLAGGYLGIVPASALFAGIAWYRSAIPGWVSFGLAAGGFSLLGGSVLLPELRILLHPAFALTWIQFGLANLSRVKRTGSSLGDTDEQAINISDHS